MAVLLIHAGGPMRVAKPILVLVLMLVWCVSASAQVGPSDGYIGVFSDATGSNCCIDATGGVTTLHVLFVTGGATSAGIVGAEFRIDVTPTSESSFFIWSATPASNISIGEPINNITPQSLNIAFPECQTVTGFAGDHIPLGTITVINATLEHELLVRPHLAPTNPNFSCPLVNLCDGPIFSQVCLTLQSGDPELAGQEPVGFRSFLNSPTCAGASCGFVSVEQSSWSGVKSLFR